MSLELPSETSPLLFSLAPHPLQPALSRAIKGELGSVETRSFPDGESFLRITSRVSGRACVVIEDLARPNGKYLPLLFLLDTLRELGAASVGLVAPYLSYMRQDRRFHDGEAVTSRLFARALSEHIDWLVTVDPHLHRYHDLNEIYSVPTRVVKGAPVLAKWLEGQPDLLLVGPDAESRQWVEAIAKESGQPFVVGNKMRYGDRRVKITLPALDQYSGKSPVIIDDVISSGHTVLECIQMLKSSGLQNIQCVAVHGIFADEVDKRLRNAGLDSLITTNTIPHSSNALDISGALAGPVRAFLQIPLAGPEKLTEPE